MAKFDEKILFGDITNLIDPEIRKLLERGLHRNQGPTFHSGPSFTC